MNSISNLINAVETILAHPEKYPVESQEVQDTLKEILEKLRETQKRDVVKDASEISLNLAQVIRILIEWLGNSS